MSWTTSGTAYHWLRPAVTITLLAVAAGLAWTAWSRTGASGSPRVVTGLIATGMVALLAAPAVWSIAGVRSAANPTFPHARPTAAAAGPVGAGPDGSGGPAGLGGAAGPGGGLDEAMLGWLREQRSGERWLVAVGGVQQAAAAIIDGDSVMPMGGFSGSDPAMTSARLSELVRDGELRFVLTGGGFGGPANFGGGGTAIDTIVATACTEVPASVGSGLYDCKGKADAITEAADTAPSGTDPSGAAPDGGGLDELESCLADQGVALPDDGAAPDLDDPDLLDALRECGLPVGSTDPGGRSSSPDPS